MGRLDRYGDPLGDDDQGTETNHSAACVDGWLGETTDGRPIACTVCRPHVKRRRRL